MMMMMLQRCPLRRSGDSRGAVGAAALLLAQNIFNKLPAALYCVKGIQFIVCICNK